MSSDSGSAKSSSSVSEDGDCGEPCLWTWQFNSHMGIYAWASSGPCQHFKDNAGDENATGCQWQANRDLAGFGFESICCCHRPDFDGSFDGSFDGETATTPCIRYFGVAA